MQDLGLKTSLYEFAPKKSNVVGILKGSSGDGGVLFSPHLDVVPAGKGWRFPPFEARVFGGRIYGRGATDCKGNLACILEALNSLLEGSFRPQRDIILACTADEETGSKEGMIPLLEEGKIKPGFAVILDSDNFDCIIAQKGLIHLKVTAFGKKAHGAYPHKGLNAIELSSQAIVELKRHTFRYQPHRLLKGPTLNVGTIEGGDKVNIVADRCSFELDLRFLPGMKPGEILSQIRRILNRNLRRYKLEVNSLQNPYQIDKGHLLVKAVLNAVRKVRGRAKVKGSEGATVITFFEKKGIPAVSLGFGQKGLAHATDEYVLIDDLYNGARVLEELIRIIDQEIF
jgi:acetylornithine deacetylase/succinyl-diaminopimelate desuccinylase family protein